MSKLNAELPILYLILVLIVFAPAAWAGFPAALQNAGRSAGAPMSDREKAGLQGPVKSCTVEQVFHSADSNPDKTLTFTTITEYDREGRLLSTRSSSGNADSDSTAYTYEEHGRLLKITSRSAGAVIRESTYAYDEAGRLSRISDQSGRFGPTSTSFEYGQSGRKTRTEVFPARPGHGVATAGSPFQAAASGAFISESGGMVVTKFNERGEPVEVETKDTDGNLIARAVRVFDASGNVSEEKSVLENPEFLIPPTARDKILKESGASVADLRAELSAAIGDSLQSRAAYKYDDRDRVIENRERVNAFGKERVVTTTYNDKGDKASEHTHDLPLPEPASGELAAAIAENDLIMDDVEVRYTYVYDSFGNWTEQVSSRSSRPGEQFTRVGTVRRKITYF